MSASVIIAAVFILSTSYVVWSFASSAKRVFLHLILLASTPWLLILLIGNISLSPKASLLSTPERISANLSYLTSGDFLFFVGDGRENFGTGDHGVFLLSFLPFILVGIFKSLGTKDKKYKLAFWWLLSGLIITISLGSISGLPAALWYLPSLSILATVGAVEMLRLYSSKRTAVPLKTLLIFSGLLFVYETIRLYHVIVIHQPFTT